MRGLVASGSIGLFLVACGGRTVVDAGSAVPGDAIDAAGGEVIDAAVGPIDGGVPPMEASAPYPDAASEVAADASTMRQFHGVVLARWIPGSATPFQAYADFAPGQPFGITCPSSPQNVGSCCCQGGIALPHPSPSSGTLQLTRLAGQGILVLVPPSTSGYQGTSDLGPGWYVEPGVYPYATSGVWYPGAPLPS
jgi:hypothetical protein